MATHPAQATPQAPWRPLTELVDHPDRFDGRVASVRGALGAGLPGGAAQVPPRVAASVTHLGLVARVLTPALVASALGQDRPPFHLEDLWWQDVPGGAVPLSCTEEPAPAGRTAVEALTLLAMDRYRLGNRVAWGNVASAANGAATTVARERPDLAAAARSAADTILRDPRLDGGHLRSGPRFRRRSCCLIYRLADTTDGTCADCVLTGP